MTMISQRLAKLEAKHSTRRTSRRVERHIIHGTSEAERQAKIAAIVAASESNVLHICRTIVEPGELKPVLQ